MWYDHTHRVLGEWSNEHIVGCAIRTKMVNIHYFTLQINGQYSLPMRLDKEIPHSNGFSTNILITKKALTLVNL